MKSYILIKTLLAVLFFLTITSCDDNVKEVTLSLANLKEASLDSGRYTEFSVLQAYPAMKTCHVGESYSNLYVCKRWPTKDTVYIFEDCESVDDLAFDSSDIYPIVLSEQSLRQHKDTAIIFVPDSFRVTKKVKFFFAKVSFLTES